MALAAEVIEITNKRLFKPFEQPGEPKKTDVGIVFGGRSTSGETARAAADLYHRGHFEKVIVAGNARIFEPGVALAMIRDRNPAIKNLQTLKDIFSFAGEADYMRATLLKNGVPEENIIMGSRSKKANLIVTDIRNLKPSFETATVIAYAPYVARTIGTFRFQGDERPLIAHPVNVLGLNPQNWHKSSLSSYVINEARNANLAHPEGYVGEFCVIPDWEQERRKNDALEPVA